MSGFPTWREQQRNRDHNYGWVERRYEWLDIRSPQTEPSMDELRERSAEAWAALVALAGFGRPVPGVPLLGVDYAKRVRSPERREAIRSAQRRWWRAEIERERWWREDEAYRRDSACAPRC